MKTLRVIIYLVVSVLLMSGGYFIRKGLEKPCSSIQTIMHDTIPYTINDTIDKPFPVLIEKTIAGDTVYLPRRIDTLAVVRDYYLNRTYETNFSSDSTGVFIVESTVSENKLVKQTAQIRPKIKTISIIKNEIVEKVKPLQLYSLVGSSIDFNVQQIQLGIDINQKLMIGISGIKFGDNLGYTINAGIKF